MTPHAPRVMNEDLRAIARALGGEVIGRQVLCPGPGHSKRDRSLSVKIDRGVPSGLLLHSFAGDDWRICRDHVLALLGLPAWQPGDEQDRTIPTSRIRSFDRAAADHESERQPRTEDDLIRIERAVRNLERGAKSPGHDRRAIPKLTSSRAAARRSRIGASFSSTLPMALRELGQHATHTGLASSISINRRQFANRRSSHSPGSVAKLAQSWPPHARTYWPGRGQA